MASQKFEGLEAIAAACGVEIDELVQWHLFHGFPLRRRGGEWWTTEAAIDAWGRARQQAERRRA